MSGQASNMTFSDSAIQRAVIERVFDERPAKKSQVEISR